MTAPLLLKCPCGHCAPLPKPLAQLVGRILKCSRCGARHTIDLAEVVKTAFAEESATEGRALH